MFTVPPVRRGAGQARVVPSAMPPTWTKSRTWCPQPLRCSGSPAAPQAAYRATLHEWLPRG